ncbi:MAG: carbohydrate porin [Phycisphaerales bacterium]
MRHTDVVMPSLLCLVLVNSAAVLADDAAQESAPRVVNSPDVEEREATAQDPLDRGTLTGGFWDLSDELASHGIEVTLGATNVYQANVRNGLDTHQKSGRLSGSYDLEIATDLEKLLGVAGLGLFVHGEGGWPDAEGIDEAMVGSVFGVNADAGGDRSLDIVETFFEWNQADGFLTLKVGKMDFAGVFDTSEYANDETSQFLNGALVNNPTIPFPDYCLGAIVSANLTDAWHVAAGMGDAEADGGETGFRTTFHGPDYFFYALETGFLAELAAPQGPLPGNYRLGLWYDPQPKAHSDSECEYRDDIGVYASVDQMLLKENDNPEDGQGLGMFARYGYADEKRNDISGFWSIGVQCQGLVEGRDEDVLGLGVASGIFGDCANDSFKADHESVVELYYRVQASRWMAISPGIQYVSHPGGGRATDDAVVVGTRAQIDF